MFERNRVDNSRDLCGIGVEITLDDGRTLTGKIAIPVSATIADALNSPAPFLEFEPYDGERQYVAKAGLRTLRPLAPTERAQSLAGRLRDGDGFDPWQVLGLAKGESLEKVKVAFHRKALAYHPDRYATAELPPEVRDYLAIMARRINAAFTVLEQANATNRRSADARTQPIYASAPR